jgi:hypothetical protein
MSGLKKCSPFCDAFRCGQRALSISRQNIYCRWADDECSGATCNYAICVRGKLLTGGICGLTVRRKTSEEPVQENNFETGVRIRGKLLRRFKEEELI